MTDKASKYPEDFGSGEEEYHHDKRTKIMIVIMIGFLVFAAYYWYQLKNDLKTNDWTLDPNTVWTCHSLQSYEKAMEISTSSAGLEFPRQLEKEINDKKVELNCR